MVNHISMMSLINHLVAIWAPSFPFWNNMEVDHPLLVKGKFVLPGAMFHFHDSGRVILLNVSYPGTLSVKPRSRQVRCRQWAKIFGLGRSTGRHGRSSAVSGFWFTYEHTTEVSFFGKGIRNILWNMMEFSSIFLFWHYRIWSLKDKASICISLGQKMQVGMIFKTLSNLLVLYILIEAHLVTQQTATSTQYIQLFSKLDFTWT